MIRREIKIKLKNDNSIYPYVYILLLCKGARRGAISAAFCINTWQNK